MLTVSTIRKKLDHVGKLFEQLRRSGKSWRHLSLPEIDAFLIDCASHFARSTTADIASTVRSFARFLLASGRIRTDLADGVIAPVQPKFERPRRALPWEDVQRLLRAVDTSTARGLRDHALLLMMSILALHSIVALTARQLVPQDSLMTRHAAWCAKDSPTFSDTIALVRRSLWSEGIYGGSGNGRDMVKIPRALFDRLTETVCYA